MSMGLFGLPVQPKVRQDKNPVLETEVSLDFLFGQNVKPPAAPVDHRHIFVDPSGDFTKKCISSCRIGLCVLFEDKPVHLF